MEQKRRNEGFTLIELMIAVVVVAIIATVAFPAYNEQVRKSKRTEGKSALVELANRMEKFAFDNTGSGYTGVTMTDLMGSATATSENGHYQLQIASAAAATYELRAVPTGSFKDSRCQTLTLDQAGRKGVTGTPAPTQTAAQCW